MNEPTNIMHVKILTCMILLGSCSSTMNKQSAIKKVDLVSQFPFVDNTGKLENQIDSLSIFYYSDYVIYRYPIGYSELKDDTTIILRDARKGELPAYNYYIFKQGGEYGYNYRSLKDSSPVRQLIDSFLRFNAFTDLQLKNDDPNYKQIEEKVKGNLMIVKKALSNSSLDYSFPDSINLYYRKNVSGIPHSLVLQLDNKKNNKLMKLELIFNHKKYENLAIPNRALILELKEKESDVTANIISLVERFRTISIEPALKHPS